MLVHLWFITEMRPVCGGGTDPCCRKPMVWEDLTYSDEVYLPADGSKKEVPDKVEFNKDLF